MAYSTSNPPRKVLDIPGAATNALWSYDSPGDALATMDTSGYITNARALGMKKGDLIFVKLWSALPTLYSDLDGTAAASPTVTWGLMGVKGITAGGAADLGDATALAANTD